MVSGAQGDDYCLPNTPPSQNWLLRPDSEVVNDGLEILSVLLGPVGSLDQWLVADPLTTDVVSDLSHHAENEEIGQMVELPARAAW